MSNTYGLDFLRQQHTLDEDGNPKSEDLPVPVDSSLAGGFGWASESFDVLVERAANKPDLEKQFDVIHFLQAHRSTGCLAPSVIYEKTGIDLQEDVRVAEMLQRNPKIRVEHVPDPENPALMIATYAYQAKYNHVRDRASLLAQINRCKNGVPRRDLEDAYDGVEADLDALITAGDVLAIANTEDKDKIIFPRGEAFLVELDGILHIPDVIPPTKPPPDSQEEEESPAPDGVKTELKKDPDAEMVDAREKPVAEPLTKTEDAADRNEISTPNGSGANAATRDPKMFLLETDIDPRTQIRRGEAIQIGGQWFRVSSAVKEGPLKDQPARAQAPLSVVSLSDLSRRNLHDGYIRPFTEKLIPCDAELKQSAFENIKRAKEARERLLKIAHGRTGGVASQLLGSHAHTSNPTTLAASFGTASTGSRKRPNKSGTLSNSAMRHDAAQAKEAASDPNLALFTHAKRHGCTMDVRQMYLDTRPLVPHSEMELRNLLVQNKLLDSNEEMRRPRLARKANLDNDGKPKKRRYYEKKNQRMTNTHLEGTEIGAVLRRFQERQRQGEQVGDGGM